MQVTLQDTWHSLGAPSLQTLAYVSENNLNYVIAQFSLPVDGAGGDVSIMLVTRCSTTLAVDALVTSINNEISRICPPIVDLPPVLMATATLYALPTFSDALVAMTSKFEIGIYGCLFAEDLLEYLKLCSTDCFDLSVLKLGNWDFNTLLLHNNYSKSETLKTLINTSNTSLGTVSTKVDAVKTDTTSIKTGVTSNGSEIALVKTDVGTIKTKVTSLNNYSDVTLLSKVAELKTLVQAIPIDEDADTVLQLTLVQQAIDLVKDAVDKVKNAVSFDYSI